MLLRHTEIERNCKPSENNETRERKLIANTIDSSRRILKYFYIIQWIIEQQQGKSKLL